MLQLIIIVCSFIGSFLALKKWHWIDKPELRSSHKSITIRSLGIAFVPIMLLAWVLNYLSGWQCIGILFAGFTGLAADFEWMPPWNRLLLYLVACILFLSGSDWFGYQGWLMLLLLAGLLVWMNLFNFMDGINGMMVLYSLVTLVTFLLLPELEEYSGYIMLLIMLVIGYSFFNLRKKALAFAGDIGSVILSICIAFPMLLAVSKSGNWWYLMFVCLYFVDAGITLLIRLLKAYNILKPHRTHLYEYLANEAGKPHIYIALGYSGIQLFLNLTLVSCKFFDLMPVYYLAIILFIVCSSAYMLVRIWVEKQYVPNPVHG